MRAPLIAILLGLTITGIGLAQEDLWCIQHCPQKIVNYCKSYYGAPPQPGSPWFCSWCYNPIMDDYSSSDRFWRECHANLSLNGESFWADLYTDPNVGIAYQINDFWNFGVFRLENTSQCSVRDIWIDPWILYLPDFYPIQDDFWDPYSYSGEYPGLNNYYKQIQGWNLKPEWKNSLIKFQGPMETRFVDQNYYKGIVGPQGGYYQARYLWDATGLGEISPGELFGIRWLLRSTEYVRPGTYVIEWFSQIHYNSSCKIKECDLEVKKWCNPVAEQAKMNSLGTYMCWLQIEADDSKHFKGITITEQILKEFLAPDPNEIKIWRIDGEAKRHKLDQEGDYQLSITQDLIQIKLDPKIYISEKKGLLIKYPLRYDNQFQKRDMLATTEIEIQDPRCISKYIFDLLNPKHPPEIQ